MSQRQQQFPYELSAVDSTASLYQASQSTPSLVPWQQQASETPELYGASGLPCGDPHLVNGGIQSRVDDWAGQAVAVTLQQVQLRALPLAICILDYLTRLEIRTTLIQFLCILSSLIAVALARSIHVPDASASSSACGIQSSSRMTLCSC